MAAAVDAFNGFAFLELGLGHAAHAVGAEVGVARLNAAQTAQVLVALLLPLGDQVGVGDLLAQTVVVELAADRLALVEQIVDVARLLVMHLEDGPLHFGLSLALVRRLLGLAHLLLQLVQRRLDQVPAIRRRFSLVSQWHFTLSDSCL